MKVKTENQERKSTKPKARFLKRIKLMRLPRLRKDTNY